MPRKQKKYHYIYKTTNLINGKYYIDERKSTTNIGNIFNTNNETIRNYLILFGIERR